MLLVTHGTYLSDKRRYTLATVITSNVCYRLFLLHICKRGPTQIHFNVGEIVMRMYNLLN
jgi:hypothetical protein